MKHFLTISALLATSLTSTAQQLEWIDSYGSTSAYEDLVKAVVTDQDGNVYITGAYHGQIQFGSFTLPALDNDNIFIAKLDSSGTCLWVQSYGGTTAGAERPMDMAIDQSGNLVVVGNFFGATTFGNTTYNSMNSDIFIFKTDPFGNLIWSRGYAGDGYDIPIGVCVDHNNNIIVNGYHSSVSLMLDGIQISTNVNNAAETLVFKLNSGGNVLWAKKGGASSFFAGNNSHDVAVDLDGNVYVIGYYTTSVVFDNIAVTGTNVESYYLAKFSSSGQIQWVKKGSGPNARVGGFGVAVSPDNRIAVTGYYDGAADFSNITAPNANSWNIFLLEYDASGSLLWHAFGVDSSTSMWSSGSARGYSVSYDEEANLYVSGRGNGNMEIFGDTAAYYLNGGLAKGEIFVLKYNAAKEFETCSWLQTADPFNTCCGLVSDTDYFFSTSRQKHAVYGKSVYLIENFVDNNQNQNLYNLQHPTGIAQIPRYGNGDFFIAKFNTCVRPEASFTKSQNLLSATFVNTSQHAESVTWLFGDGSTASGNTATHTYTSPGYYTICLIATSECGVSDTTCQGILLSCPLPISSFSHTSDSLTASFNNLSTNYTSQTWQFNNGITSNAQNPNHQFPPGTYLVCLTVTNFCGSAASCQTVSITCPPPPATFTYTIDSLTVVFTHQGSIHDAVSWQFGDGTSATGSTPVHTYAPGTYEVCLTSENFCGSSSTCQTVTVTCSGSFSIYLDGEEHLCVGDSALLYHDEDISNILWSTGESTPTVTITNAGTYTANGMLDGCTMSSNTVTFTEGLTPIVVQAGDELSCYLFFESYQWYLNDTVITGATSQNYTPTESGSFHVVVTDEHGCVTASLPVEVILSSIQSVSSSGEIQVFPNPAHDQLNLTLTSVSGQQSYEIINGVGQVALSGNVLAEHTRIDVHGLAEGVYVLRLVTDGRAIHHERFVVMR